jgi:curved DNA-binding protein CbpA
MSAPTDPYKILQVDAEAEDEVIQAAYRRLAQKYHPDVAGPSGAERMAAINAAWELLRDPNQRAAYDRERMAATMRSNAAAQSSRGAGTDAGSRPGSVPTSGARPGTSPTGPTFRPRRAETVSSDWTSGRSGSGGGYDPSRMRAPEGHGAAGRPPGNPSGSVIPFGRYAGWSLGEIGRRDVDYLEWLDRMAIGRPYRDEIDVILRAAGRRRSAPSDGEGRRGLFRRR